jgi:hypothetical protein
MIPIWLLPIMTTLLCGLAGWLGWRAAVMPDRNAAYRQELRDIDTWLETMWKA